MANNVAALLSNPQLASLLMAIAGRGQGQGQQRVPIDPGVGQALPVGFQQFTSPDARTRGIPVSPVGPGTLGGAPYRRDRRAEMLSAVLGGIANTAEALRVRRERMKEEEKERAEFQRRRRNDAFVKSLPPRMPGADVTLPPRMPDADIRLPRDVANTLTSRIR